MTTYTPFVPSAVAPFSFQPTLDGIVYNVVVKWNLFGRRWFIFIYTLQGQLILTQALIGSPPKADINMIYLYFKSTMIFRQSAQQFEVSP